MNLLRVTGTVVWVRPLWEAVTHLLHLASVSCHWVQSCPGGPRADSLLGDAWTHFSVPEHVSIGGSPRALWKQPSTEQPLVSRGFPSGRTNGNQLTNNQIINLTVMGETR